MLIFDKYLVLVSSNMTICLWPLHASIGKHASRRPLTQAGKVHRPQKYHREEHRPRRYDHQEEPTKYWSCSFPVEECYRKNLCRPHAACTCHSSRNECESRFRDNCETDNVSFPIIVLAMVLLYYVSFANFNNQVYTSGLPAHCETLHSSEGKNEGRFCHRTLRLR